MVQGTSSSVGKSVITAALCRILAQDDVNVAPFKAQNMSNNSYVTADGGEMGRAQVVQAQAAGVEPHTDMNPVLLKPEADSRSQVVINGKPVGSFEARRYWGDQTVVWTAVTEAYDRLSVRHDVIVLEGAGSPAEVNLRDRDIVNMRMAAYAGASVILVGDIDRGGVFASLLGTLELLTPEERAMVKALVINRFRGDRTLLDPLPEMIAKRTGLPVAGVVPFLYDLQVKDEDGVTFGDFDPPGTTLPRTGGALEMGSPLGTSTNLHVALRVAVIGLPRVSNHDDIDPFRRAGCRVMVITSPQELANAHIVIIPGSKSTIADLRWIKSRKLDKAIVEAADRGVTVIGICGGYQILGRHLDDPNATESPEPQSEPGIGLLPVNTVFDTEKTTRRVNVEILETSCGPLRGATARGTGYEIHSGITTGETTALSTLSADSTPAPRTFSPVPPGEKARLRGIERPPATTHTWSDGAISGNLPVIGTYVHGLFDSPDILRRLLITTADAHGLPSPQIPEFSMEAEYDRLEDAVRESLDMNLIRSLLV
ncbi:MAG: cobyric acid synthase [Chloroflexi bacterium]|nr:cobyric acid synthase [Chloroflexota bacterium]